MLTTSWYEQLMARIIRAGFYTSLHALHITKPTASNYEWRQKLWTKYGLDTRGGGYSNQKQSYAIANIISTNTVAAAFFQHFLNS